jgi:hypothetical protein
MSYAVSRSPLSLVLAVAVAACGSDEGARLAVSTTEIVSPAGANSGEPFLSESADGAVFMSWLEAEPGGGHDLRFARFDGTDFSEVRKITHSDRFFVNWADFPSLTPGPGGTLWAHWLERGAKGGYDYGVRIAHSADGGDSWSEPWTPHDDASPTEHGFVSAVADDGGVGFLWLDGRQYAPGADGSEPTMEMTLRYRRMGADGRPGPETLVDGRVCDCCQTAAATTSSGPVVVYRNRTDEEIRDIYISRQVHGVWTEGLPVHDDGWEIAGCPVNGPAIAAQGDDVVVGWFAAPGDAPRVNVAFSSDGGATFGAPQVVDGGSPAGRVDILMTDEGAALVVWLERTGGEDAEVRMREVTSDGMSESFAVTRSSAGRASGFPRMARSVDGDVVVAWTDVDGEAPRVRVTKLTLER